MPQFGAQIDTMRIPVKGLTPEQSASALTLPTEGLLWHDTNSKHVFVWLNGAWVQVDNAAGGAPDPSKQSVRLATTAAITTSGAQTIDGFPVNNGDRVLVKNNATDNNIYVVNTSGAWTVASDVDTTAEAQGAYTYVQQGTANNGTFWHVANGSVTDMSALFWQQNSGPPTGAAGGSLTGTYPNPTLAANSVGSSQITDGSIQAGDIAAGVIPTSLPPSGTAGGDLTGTYPNPTIGVGKVDSSKILDGSVAAGDLNLSSVRLDTIGAPTGAVSMNGQRITAVGDPTNPQDAATKAYVDSIAQGLDPKASVKAASTGNVSLASPVTTLDGVSLVNGDRYLLKNQTNPQENGIYWGTAASLGNPVRVADMDSWAEVPAAFTFVEQGTVNADTGWVCTSDQGGTLGTTAINWAQFSGAGSITAGAGLTKSGNTLDVGAGPGITVNADTIQVANDGITNAMIADGAINLGTADVTGTLPIAKGGTGATTASAARTALGVPTIVQANIPALSPGVYTTVPGIVKPSPGGPMGYPISVSFGFAAGGNTGASGGVFLDWLCRGTQEDFQVKADVTVAANTYNVTVVMSG